jgi:hypothetical protein
MEIEGGLEEFSVSGLKFKVIQLELGVLRRDALPCVLFLARITTVHLYQEQSISD